MEKKKVAPGIGCIEGIKELVHALTVNADGGIPHHHAHAVTVLSLSSGQQLPRSTRYLIAVCAEGPRRSRIDSFRMELQHGSRCSCHVCRSSFTRLNGHVRARPTEGAV